MSSVWRTTELSIPKSLELFVRDWICCEHALGKWRWKMCHLWLTFFSHIHPFEQKNGFTMANVRLLLCQTAATFLLLSFTTLSLRLHNVPFLTMCGSILRDRHPGCAIQEYDAHWKSWVFDWKETNVAFWESSLWHGSAVVANFLHWKTDNLKKRALPYQCSASWMTCGSCLALQHCVCLY